MAIPAFDAADYALQRAVLRTLPAGTLLAHTHRDDPNTGEFPFNAFNPYADTRFAGLLATPRRAGYYAGTTPSCALWESDLRHVVGDRHGWVSLHRQQVRHRRLSFIRTTRPLTILDLFASSLAGMVADKAIQHRWMELTTIDAHGPTHAPAAALLAQLEAWGRVVDGFAWNSRQCGTADSQPIVYAFFEPPASSGDFEKDPDRLSFMLDSALGWAEIDRALALAGLRRAASGPGVGAALAPPQPGDEP